MEIQSLKINANSNATESISLIKNCFSFLIPSYDKTLLTTKQVSGGYGNPIITLKFHSSNKNNNLTTLKHIASELNPQDKIQIAEELERRINPKGVFHVRFSKRDLAQQKIILSTQSDSFRVLMKFSLHNHRIDIKKNFNELREFLSEIGIIES